MNIAKLLLVAALTLLALNSVPLLKAVASSTNEVKIQDDKIVWTYVAQGMPSEENQKQLSRNVTITYNQVLYTAKDRLLRSDEAISTNITLVFIGRERIYFRFMHARPNATITLDSNIIMDENEIVVQWFSVKTRGRTAIEEDRAIDHVQLDRHIAEVLKALDIPMIKRYSAYMLRIPMRLESIESINIYDIVIDKELYAHSLRELGIQKDSCGNFEEMPAYAWIETDMRIEGDEKIVAVSVTGLSNSSMYSGIRMTSCTIPMLNTLIKVVESLNLSTYYAKVIKEYGIDVKETIMNYHIAYVENVTHYIKLFEELMDNIPKDRSIKIEYNIFEGTLHLRVVIDGIAKSDLDLQEVRNMLLKTLEAFSAATKIENPNWRSILDNVHVYSVESGTREDEAMGALMAGKAIIVTYVLVVVQVVVIAIAILNILKPRPAKP